MEPGCCPWGQVPGRGAVGSRCSRADIRERKKPPPWGGEGRGGEAGSPGRRWRSRPPAPLRSTPLRPGADRPPPRPAQARAPRTVRAASAQVLPFFLRPFSLMSAAGGARQGGAGRRKLRRRRRRRRRRRLVMVVAARRGSGPPQVRTLEAPAPLTAAAAAILGPRCKGPRSCDTPRAWPRPLIGCGEEPAPRMRPAPQRPRSTVAPNCRRAPPSLPRAPGCDGRRPLALGGCVSSF